MQYGYDDPYDIAARYDHRRRGLWTLVAHGLDRLVGRHDNLIDGPAPRRHTPQRRFSPATTRTAAPTVDISSIVLHAVEMVTSSVQPVVFLGEAFPENRTLYLHHAPEHASTMTDIWSLIQEAVHAGIEDWCQRALAGKPLDIVLHGPITDPSVSRGGWAWLSEAAHHDRLDDIARGQSEAERRAADDARRAQTDVGRLQLVHGEGPDQITLAPHGPTVIGRDEALGDAAIHQLSTSCHHAEITITPRGATIRDLGSLNGTTVNGVEIQTEVDPVSQRRPAGQPHPLRNDAVIQLGRTDDSATYLFVPPTTGIGMTHMQSTRSAGHPV
jgi:hypothetical protein